MPHRNQLTWGELRVGIFVLAGLTLLIVAIFYVTGFGVLTPKYRLVTYLPDVSGLTTGAPVSVGGFAVGNVDKIMINTPKDSSTPDPARNIEVVMRIDEKFKDNIRSDSRASLVTQGLLGNQSVSITRGFKGVPLQDNQEVPGQPQNGINELLAEGADLEKHFNALTDQLNGLIVDVRAGKGTVGKLVTNDDAYNKLVGIEDRADTMMASVQAGQGFIGKLYTDPELYNRVNTSVGHIENIVGAVRNQQGTFGKLIYTSDLSDSMNKFMASGNDVLDNIKAGKGTIGKLYTDDSLFSTYKQAGANLSAATSKFNDTSSSVGKMFNDPQLYDNLTGATADIRLLLNDFRQNPKKFLRVKFSIF
jgi:phospholipid/cholesterol/gamma-HCH transport system substrate-binding protein